MTKSTPDNEQLLKSYRLINQAFNALRNSIVYRELKQTMNDNASFVLATLQRDRAFNNHLLNKNNGTVNQARSGRRKRNNQNDAPTSESPSPETLETIHTNTPNISSDTAPADASENSATNTTEDAAIDATIDASLKKLLTA